MKHPLITCAAALFATASLAAPSPVEAAPVGARLVEWAGAHDRPVDIRREVLRLECVARPTDDAAAVRCVWSAPTSDAAVGVRLVRSSKVNDPNRLVVFRTGDLGITEFVDAPVRRGVRYRYAVQAVDVDGRVVGLSRPVTVGVAVDEPSSVEALRLECAAERSDTDERARVGCRWSLPTESTPRLLTLWRSVDGGARERVETFAAPFEASYRDVVPAGTTRVVYAVIGTDGAGGIVARSRAEHVALRPGSPSTTAVPVRDVAPVTDAPVATAPRTAATSVATRPSGVPSDREESGPNTAPVRETVPTTTDATGESTTDDRADADRNSAAARVGDRRVGG